MTVGIIFLTLLVLAASSYFFTRQRSVALVSGELSVLHSLPGHYGWYAAVWTFMPGVVWVVLWVLFGSLAVDALVMGSLPDDLQPATPSQERLLLNDIHNIAAGDVASDAADPRLAEAAQRYNAWMGQGRLATFAIAVLFAALGMMRAFQTLRPDLRARNALERFLMVVLVICSAVAILTTLGIVLSLLFESLRFFARISPVDFLFGIHWSPQTALRADQVAAEGAFGAIPLFAGTMLISLVAMLVAVPIGLLSAVYMTQYASNRVRQIAKPILEILAGVPTVVYGFFAALQVAPFVRDTGEAVCDVSTTFALEFLPNYVPASWHEDLHYLQICLEVASESALAAGLVMGIMIIPFMSSLSDDAITAVPQAMRDGSFGLGATKSETITQVLIPAALPGIVGAFLLSVSRAIGETMIVVMAAGLAANLTANPLEAVTTVTAQIVALLTGDQEFDSAKTLSAFALGLVLFSVTLVLNVIALRVVRKYRETYE